MTGDSAAPVFTLTPGPAGATPATLAALSQPILHHQDPAFLALYAETVESLRRAFGTGENPVIFPGEAVVGRLIVRRYPLRSGRVACRPGRGGPAEMPRRTARTIPAARQRGGLAAHGG
jgi:hypothetical protein